MNKTQCLVKGDIDIYEYKIAMPHERNYIYVSFDCQMYYFRIDRRVNTNM